MCSFLIAFKLVETMLFERQSKCSKVASAAGLFSKIHRKSFFWRRFCLQKKQSKTYIEKISANKWNNSDEIGAVSCHFLAKDPRRFHLMHFASRMHHISLTTPPPYESLQSLHVAPPGAAITHVPTSNLWSMRFDAGLCMLRHLSLHCASDVAWHHHRILW